MNVWTTKDFAEVLGKTERHIGDLVKEGCPCMEAHHGGKGGVKRTYDPVATVQWLLVRESRKADAKAAASAGVAEISASEARKKAADAEMAEVKLAERRRELLTVSDYRDGMARLIVGAKAQLMAIAPRLRAQVGPEVAGKVDTEIRATLETLGREAGGVPQPS